MLNVGSPRSGVCVMEATPAAVSEKDSSSDMGESEVETPESREVVAVRGIGSVQVAVALVVAGAVVAEKETGAVKVLVALLASW